VKNDTAGTAFGLLPLLAARQTHRGGHPYARNIDAGLKFLLSQQGKDGNLGGGMYAHGLATQALGEAYAMTKDPALRAPAQRAIDYIVAAQHQAGGWRYSPKQAGDTSVTGFQVMALKTGQMAGLNVPATALRGAEKFLESVGTPDGSGYGYTALPEQRTTSAIGLLCRQYLGWSPRHVGLQKGVERIKEMPPGKVQNIYHPGDAPRGRRCLEGMEREDARWAHREAGEGQRPETGPPEGQLVARRRYSRRPGRTNDDHLDVAVDPAGLLPPRAAVSHCAA
jgi:hypothetical protein